MTAASGIEFFSQPQKILFQQRLLKSKKKPTRLNLRKAIDTQTPIEIHDSQFNAWSYCTWQTWGWYMKNFERIHQLNFAPMYYAIQNKFFDVGKQIVKIFDWIDYEWFVWSIDKDR